MASNDGSRAGERFGPYELRRLIGRGGMGDVYEAYDTVKDRTVALKLLPAALSSDGEYRERFRREAHMAARLQEPHVIPIHDFGEIDGQLFIDMRLVNGQDLRRVLQDRGQLPVAAAVELLSQVASALDAAHADGLVHRDVKPENVLVTAEGFAYLADFGIAARDSESRLTQEGSAFGSFKYMAPERFRGGEVTAAADVYSLTCLLVECVAGQPPFVRGEVGALVAAHLQEAPPVLSSVAPAVPSGLDGVVAQGLAKIPTYRFGSAGELMAAARSALGSADGAQVAAAMQRHSEPTVMGQLDTVTPRPQPQHDPAHSAPEQDRPRSRGVAIPIAAGVVVLAVIAGVVGVLLSRNHHENDAAPTQRTPAATQAGREHRPSPDTATRGVRATNETPTTGASSSSAAPSSGTSSSSSSARTTSSATAPSATEHPGRAAVPADAEFDEKGWPGDLARCDGNDTALMVGSATYRSSPDHQLVTSKYVICDTGGDKIPSYYRGTDSTVAGRAETTDVGRVGDGWRATRDGSDYDITSKGLTITVSSTGKVFRTERGATYWEAYPR